MNKNNKSNTNGPEKRATASLDEMYSTLLQFEKKVTGQEQMILRTHFELFASVEWIDNGVLRRGIVVGYTLDPRQIRVRTLPEQIIHTAHITNFLAETVEKFKRARGGTDGSDN